jgi:hypothetical protein
MFGVFGVFFSIMAVVALLSICGEFAMSDKLLWWRLGGDEVAATYEGLFPHSRLPLFRRSAFWLFITFSVVVFLAIMWIKLTR